MSNFDMRGQQVTHQHIEGVNRDLLQRQTNIIEGNLINIKGAVMVFPPVVSPLILSEMHQYLDAAMRALLEVKQELGLTSQLKQSTVVNSAIVSDE